MNSTLSILTSDAMENVPQLIISVCSVKPGQLSFLLALSFSTKFFWYTPLDGYDSGNFSNPFCFITDGSITAK